MSVCVCVLTRVAQIIIIIKIHTFLYRRKVVTLEAVHIEAGIKNPDITSTDVCPSARENSLPWKFGIFSPHSSQQSSPNIHLEILLLTVTLKHLLWKMPCWTFPYFSLSPGQLSFTAQGLLSFLHEVCAKLWQLWSLWNLICSICWQVIWLQQLPQNTHGWKLMSSYFFTGFMW